MGRPVSPSDSLLSLRPLQDRNSLQPGARESNIYFITYKKSAGTKRVPRFFLLLFLISRYFTAVVGADSALVLG